MARSLLILSAALLFLSSCNQLDDVKSNEDILIGGQWKRSSLKASYRDPATGNIINTDPFLTLPDCVKDNGLVFNVNYTAKEQRNNNCSPGDPSEVAITWGFYESGTRLRVYNALETFGTNDINAEVLTLSDNLLAMKYLVIDQDPMTQITDTVIVTDVFRR